VKHHIQLAPFSLDRRAHRRHLLRFLDVQRKVQLSVDSERHRQLLRKLTGLVVEVGHRDVGSERLAGAGAAVGDGILVGDAGDQDLLTLQYLTLRVTTPGLSL
jgi:hypothetical protein